MAIPRVPETSSLRQQVHNFNRLEEMGAEEMVKYCNRLTRTTGWVDSVESVVESVEKQA